MKNFYLLFAATAVSLTAAAEVPLTGNGTQSNPYLIRNSADWTALAEYVKSDKDTFKDKYIRLESDIDLSGTGFQSLWADNTTYFMGYFDGNNHKVYGINTKLTGTYGGVFGTIGAEGIISNLTLSGAITSESVTSGAFAGRSYGTIRGCVNEIEFSSARPASGGFVGRAFAGAKFIDCVNKAKISGTINVGGIAGTTEAGITFERCGNEGAIYATGTNAGGIVAQSYPSVFTDCYNTADFNISGNATYIGGIAGQVTWAANSQAEYKFIRCRNEGDLTGPRYIAGIMATIATLAGTVTVDIEDCHNYGNITSTATTISNYGAAGISCAYVPFSSFTDCTNSGNITTSKIGINGGIAGGALGTFNAQKTASFLRCSNSGRIISSAASNGGIIGTVNGYTSITECHNTGDVEAGAFSGGIVGSFDGLNNAMARCWNTGNITTDSNRAGGLFGANTKNGVTVRDSWNAGAVVSTSSIASLAENAGSFAIGGLAGIAAAKFYNCFNLGFVKGLMQAGGIAGRPFRNQTCFDHCYNTGTIDAPADQRGDLIGIDTSDTSQWSAANKATECYYAIDFGDNPLDKIGTPTTIAELCNTNMGADFLAPRPYMLPLPSSMEANEAAMLYTAMVVPETGQTLDRITGIFHVGMPQGIVWTSTIPQIRFDGNTGWFTDKVSGQAVLTAALGNYSKQTEIGLDIATGIDDLTTGLTVVSEEIYDLQGHRVMPVENCKGVCIIISHLSDGTIRTSKTFR